MLHFSPRFKSLSSVLQCLVLWLRSLIEWRRAREVCVNACASAHETRAVRLGSAAPRRRLGPLVRYGSPCVSVDPPGWVIRSHGQLHCSGRTKASALESSRAPFTCFSELGSLGGHAQALTSISLWVITFVLASGGNGLTFSQSVLGTVLELEAFRSHSTSLRKDLSWSSVAWK
ncbi:uncharacterized [Tachysurus ichikawai]